MGNEKPGNGMGVAGFVLSLVGWLSCGFVSPIALVLSAIGMKREPKGMATAGLVLSILGSLWLFVFGLGMIAGIIGIGAVAEGVVGVAKEMSQLMQVVEEHPEFMDLPDAEMVKKIRQQEEIDLEDSRIIDIIRGDADESGG